MLQLQSSHASDIESFQTVKASRALGASGHRAAHGDLGSVDGAFTDTSCAFVTSVIVKVFVKKCEMFLHIEMYVK